MGGGTGRHERNLQLQSPQKKIPGTVVLNSNTLLRIIWCWHFLNCSVTQGGKDPHQIHLVEPVLSWYPNQVKTQHHKENTQLNNPDEERHKNSQQNTCIWNSRTNQEDYVCIMTKDKGGFILALQGWSKMNKWMNAIHHVRNLRDEIFWSSPYIRKCIWLSSLCLHDDVLQKLEKDKTYLNLIIGLFKNQLTVLY